MIAHLLDELVKRSIRIRRDGDHLIVDAPPAAMTDDLRDAIRAQKAELLAFPACGSCARWPLLLPETRAAGICLRCMPPEQYAATIKVLGERCRQKGAA